MREPLLIARALASLFAPHQPIYANGSAPSPQSPQPQSQSQSQSLAPCNSSSYSSSPRQLPSDLPDPILEEGIESGSDYPAEPVTPTSASASGRHSQEWASFPTGAHYNYLQPSSSDETTQQLPANPPASLPKTPIVASESSTPTDSLQQGDGWRPATTSTLYASQSVAIDETEPELDSAPLTRRSTRGSTSSFKRTMSSLFRRSAPQVPMPATQPKDDGVISRISTSAADSTRPRISTATAREKGGPPPSKSSRRFSMHRSTTTTRSNTPPSPTSPLEISNGGNHMGSQPAHSIVSESLPNSDDFSAKKKNRSSSGLSLGLRGRAVNFVTGHGPGHRRDRASSFDSTKRTDSPHVVQQPPCENDNQQTYPPERLPWPLPPDAGTGAKARRMSLSLPDDFTVDIVELTKEFEYESKFLGRHGKHLGKGAASKVTLMSRKGCPTELYAVKEFRGKSGRESKDDYDKKIKSEYSIAKSLHHPNIIETFRLCTDHSRWNHVMEYCSEGDLFSLVSKGWLKPEDKKKDRLCLFKQLIQGVNYLHSNGIAHRDIKLENLLISKDSKLKITDFGVSEVFCGTHPGVRESGGQCGQNMGDIRLCSPGICGSEPYIAPEVLAKKSEYDPRALDVWSSAVVMIYLIFGGAIWPRAQPGINKVYDNLVKGWDKWYKNHPDPDATITETDYPHCTALDFAVSPPALRRLMLQMLNPDPSRRISINQVINNRWMKNVECCQAESYDDPTHVIDASKPDASWNGPRKIFCHSHLPPKTKGSHSLGAMPGQPGY
ncbi:unnamed protein product [Clonostachys rosea f. rosea IK726]|uniref:Uncharacterized protein n=1 Tax=Clonostachys rosea f. rosea IK726 TaxID=1349383 RepID=A0ACA9U9B7_BIOOC|nr:unnamed protein product [Clonostachys rosea f. rosea IK726]